MASMSLSLDMEQKLALKEEMIALKINGRWFIPADSKQAPNLERIWRLRE